jgi:phage shock protein PspC (stress-responsive transcriptional regulator)
MYLLGEKLDMRTSVIRLFFIYATFLTCWSPIIIYMILPLG